jgi:hypothetical protein
MSKIPLLSEPAPSNGIKGLEIETVKALSGGFGRYQVILYLAFLTLSQSTISIIYPMALLQKVPPYKCQNTLLSIEPYPCTPTDFCGNPSIKYWPDYSHPNKIALKNWV